jgi:hypothetical protein
MENKYNINNANTLIVKKLPIYNNVGKCYIDVKLLSNMKIILGCIDTLGNISEIFTIHDNNDYRLKYTIKTKDKYIALINVSKTERVSCNLSKFSYTNITDTVSNKITSKNLNNPISELDVDIIYYINLESRKERRYHIEKQLVLMGIPKTQVVRIDAVYMPNNPQVGCALSHMKALSDASKRKVNSCLVLEDDFTFTCSRKSLDDNLKKLNYYLPNWDVIMMSSINEKSNHVGLSNIFKVVKADTTSSYIVKSEAIIYLFNIFKNCINPPVNCNTNQFAIDVAWQQIQPKLNWYIFKPYLGKQSEQFVSDIEKFRSNKPLLQSF